MGVVDAVAAEVGTRLPISGGAIRHCRRLINNH
jgi:hypothetical protein